MFSFASLLLLAYLAIANAVDADADTTADATSNATIASLSGFTVGKSVKITNVSVATCAPQKFVLTKKNAPFVAVHFDHFHVLPGDLVSLSTPNNSEIVDIPPQPDAAVHFSSPRLGGPTVVLTFTPKTCLATLDHLPKDFGFHVDALEYTFAHAIREREICGSGNQNQAAACFKNAYGDGPVMYAKAKAVTRLIKTLSLGNQVGCTGFLLGSQGHVMTNYHCISSADEAAQTTFEFMVETPECQQGCVAMGDCRNYGTLESTGADFVYASEKYDFAVVKLHADPATLEARYGHLSLRRAAAVVNETIYIAHHPMGGAKQIAATQDVTGNDQVYTGDSSSNWAPIPTQPAVVALVNDANRYGDFWTSYYADTETGSSGTPVISRTSHHVLAVHSNGACENSGAPSNLIIKDLADHQIQLPADAYAD